MSDEYRTIAPALAVDDLDGVRSFARALFDAGISFHPDTPASDYGHTPTGRMGDWQTTFTAGEAALVDAALGRSFDVCAEAGEDIYGIACAVFEEWEQAQNRSMGVKAVRPWVG